MVFWLVIALMTALALAFVLAPLVRDPGLAARRRAEAALHTAHAAGALNDKELQAKLKQLQASDAPGPRPPRAVASAFAVLLPFLAGAMYFRLGEPRALDPASHTSSGGSATAPAADGSAPDAEAPGMDQAVAGLAERLKSEPDNFDGWLLLGRAYKTMERFAEAKQALANTVRLMPDDPDALVEYGEAVALASESRRIEGESLQMIDRAVAAKPDHQRGLWLLGVASMQAQKPADAVQRWETLRSLLGDDADAVKSLDEQIEGARQAAGMPPAENSTATVAAPEPAAAPAGPQLTVKVDISPELRAQLAATDVLFVFARAANGSKMPLAIERMPAGSLPVTVTLDDSDSMMPELRLSTLPEVIVGARVSKSGQAIPQSGDYEVFSAPIPSNRSEPLTLLIDAIVP